jgi:hypothetical protein
MPAYDHLATAKALAEYTIAYIGLDKYADKDVPEDVAEDIGKKMNAAMHAGLGAAAEVERLRQLIGHQRLVHLPMPSGADGMPVVCQDCSTGGTMIPWPCGVWKFADNALADKDKSRG